MKLIGLTGRARSGKDTVASYLGNKHKTGIYAFADPIKKACCNIFGITMDQFDDPALKEKNIPYWGMSPRVMAQKLGTECGRDVFRKDIWIKRAELEWKNFNDMGVGLIVSDVRFENESDWIRSEGGIIIHVSRDDAQSVSEHVSEAGIKFVDGDLRIDNNGTIKELYQLLEGVE